MNNNYNWETVGKRIKQARERAGLTQGELGEKINYGYQMVGKWERGEVHPSLDSLFSLCNVFECELGYLLGEYDCYTRETTDIQAITGLSERAVERIKHNGEKKFKDGYYDITHGMNKKLFNAFLESEEFHWLMVHFLHYYLLATTSGEVSDTLDGEPLTGGDEMRANRVAEAMGSVILEKKEAAEFYLSLAADHLKQFAKRVVEDKQFVRKMAEEAVKQLDEEIASAEGRSES